MARPFIKPNALLMALLVASAEAAACPSFLLVQDVFPALPNYKRRDLALFAAEDGADGRSMAWQRLPLQIDPLNEDGKLVFFKPQEHWLDRPLEPLDRLTLPSDRFGRSVGAREPFPCGARRLDEIRVRRDGKDRFAYLASCPGTPASADARPVSHDHKEREVTGAGYRYRYSSSNHLMFQSIALASGEKRGADPYPLVVSEDADQLIRGDVKNFFTLNFDADDVDAFIINERSGTLGMVGQLSFFLKILFFQIDLELRPEVNFFPDSVFVPMIMHLPVDARKYLNPGSGLFYTWRLGRGVRWLESESSVPSAKVDLIKKGGRELASYGLAHCPKTLCQFSMKGAIGDRKFALDFNIDRSLVAKGFFPMLIDDPIGLERGLGWAITNKGPTTADRSGFYFETSGLPQGEHGWEFWIRLAGNDSPGPDLCPPPADSRRVLLAPR